MENFGRLMINLLVESKLAMEAELAEKDVRSAKLKESDMKNVNRNNSVELKRTINLGVKTLVRSLSEDSSWQAAQARRKFDKEDMLNNNPGFDPIFMKV